MASQTQRSVGRTENGVAARCGQSLGNGRNCRRLLGWFMVSAGSPIRQPHFFRFGVARVRFVPEEGVEIGSDPFALSDHSHRVVPTAHSNETPG